jgi:hypothetical protein
LAIPARRATYVRRVGRVLRARAAASGDRRHQSGGRRPYRNSTTPTDGRLDLDYPQLGFRVPAIVVSNLARRRVIHDGPFEHTSTLKMIESTFGLHPFTARDANAVDLRQVLHHEARHPVPRGLIPTSSQVPGPPPTPRSAAPPASSRSLRPRYPKAQESPRCPFCRSPVSNPNWDGGIGAPLQQGDNQVSHDSGG